MSSRTVSCITDAANISQPTPIMLVEAGCMIPYYALEVTLLVSALSTDIPKLVVDGELDISFCNAAL